MIITDKHGMEWHWPDDDIKLAQVIDWVEDIDYIMQFVDKTDVCIQAGGAVGQWPVRFSELFDRVFTFEPHIANYECLRKNTEAYPNITAYKLALGRSPGKVSMRRDESEDHNSGAYYTSEGVDIIQITIDSLNLAPDLIQLDVEGAELEVLAGAKETLKKHKPVVVVEEKPLPHHKNYLDARRYLEYRGYKQVGQIHRDVVFKFNG